MGYTGNGGLHSDDGEEMAGYEREWQVTQGMADYTATGRVHWGCWVTQRTAGYTQCGGLHALWCVTHSMAGYMQHSRLHAARWVRCDTPGYTQHSVLHAVLQVTGPEHLFYEALFPSHCCPAPVWALQGLCTRSTGHHRGPATPRRSSACPGRARLCPAGGSPRLTEASLPAPRLPPVISLSHVRAFADEFFVLA